jgi:hypothetical protein
MYSSVFRSWCVGWLALAASCLAVSLCQASPYTLTYDFAGGPAINPGPFLPSSSSPPTPFVVNASFTASSTDIVNVFPHLTQVRQSSSGLGVFSFDDPVNSLGIGTEVSPQAEQIDGLGGGTGPLGPFFDDGFPERLDLTFNFSNGLVSNPKLTAVRLDNFNNPDTTEDFQILLNGIPLSGSGYDFGTGTITFTTPISLSNGDVLSFVPLSLVFLPNGGIVGSSNAFSLRGLDVQVTITPEPGTMALFGLGLLGVVGVTLRRKLRAA